jgi:signal transduction histidine kinase
MSRLYLRFYAALLGSLIVFAVAAGLIWHRISGPQERFAGTVGILIQNALPPAAASAEVQQGALQKLVAGSDAEIALRAVDGAIIAKARSENLSADAAPPAHAGSDEPAVTFRLPDGRSLTARVSVEWLHPIGTLLLFLSILALAVGVGAYPIVRRLTKRLERLQLGVESLGAGDLAARVAVEGKDEVASLAQSFNRAAGRIEALVGAHKTLLANASHELRTPLARIRLGVEMLKDSADPKRRAGLDQDIAELDQLIDEVMLASRLDAVAELEDNEAVDLVALAAEECSRYPSAQLDGDPVSVRGDPRLLRRLLRNLLENAQRHGAPPVHVRITRDANTAQINVSDEGQGIPAEERERVFEPFYRRKQPGPNLGAGLGLALVRQIARRHGGDAQCEPGAGARSRFVVRLPIEMP